MGNIFKYRRILPNAYLAHLESKWVILNKFKVGKLKKNFTHGWMHDEHVMSFAIHLNREQTRLAQYTPPITISDTDKNQHYMEEIWKRPDLFTQVTMTEWGQKALSNRTYAHSVPFFEEKIAAMEAYEAAISQTGNQFASTNDATELFALTKEQHKENIVQIREEHALAMISTIQD